MLCWIYQCLSLSFLNMIHLLIKKLIVPVVMEAMILTMFAHILGDNLSGDNMVRVDRIQPLPKAAKNNTSAYAIYVDFLSSL